MYKKKKVKYEKSINGRRCIGPCYYPNVPIKHPISLNVIKNEQHSVCPTKEYVVKNEITGKEKEFNFDKCLNPTHNEDISNVELLVIMQSGFSKDSFLEDYYDIHSFEEAVDWLNNNMFIPLETQMRVMNASLNAYGNDIDFFNEIFVKFFIIYLKKKKIKTIYKNIHKNLGIVNGKVSLIKSDKNNLEYDDNIVERMDYIVDNFVTMINVENFFIKDVEPIKSTFENYDDPLDLMTLTMVEYIKRIIKTKL